MTQTARCACGALTVETTGAPAAVIACHCTECQRRTGSAFGIGAYYMAEQVKPAGAAKSFARDGAEGRRLVNYFCPGCGTTLYWTADLRPGMVGVAAGGFNDPAFPKPDFSLWEKRRLDWVTMSPDIPGTLEGRGSKPSR